MSRANEIVIALNALVVVLVMFRGVMAFRRGMHEWRPFHAAVVAIAGIYLASYGWLLFCNVDRQTWSEVMVGVSLVAWPVIWIAPSEFSIRSQRSVDRLRTRVVQYEDVLKQSDDERCVE